MKKRNPWPGLASYEDGNYQFCGRHSASIELINIIDNFLFVTLYGRTGIGKTSLLRAGVFPILQMRTCVPIYIRLGKMDKNNEDGERAPLAQLLIEALTKAVDSFRLRQHDDCFSVNQLDPQDEKFLWRYFHTRRFARANSVNGRKFEEVCPVIILDQFEELFSQRPKDVDLFLRQLRLVVSDVLLVPKEKGYVPTVNCRFVVSIREDCLYHIEDAIDRLHLPELRRNRYRLSALTPDEAKEVITVPGNECMPDNDEERKQVVDDIIKAAQEEGRTEAISPLMLSLICSQLYEELEENQKFRGTEVAVQSKDALKKFYHKVTNSLPVTQRQQMEELLVRDGHRESVSLEKFNKLVPDGSYLYLQKENRILRVDANGVEITGDQLTDIGEKDLKSYSVEIIHDQLARMIEDQKADTRLEVYKQRIAHYKNYALLVIGAALTIVFTCFLPKILWNSTVDLDENVVNVHLNYEWQRRPFSIPTGVLNLARNDTVYFKTFLRHPELRELHLGDHCFVQSNSFQQCPNLRSLYLDGKDITIGRNAFSGCDHLETIVVSDSCTIRYIDNQDGLPALKNIVIGDNPQFMAFGNSLLVRQIRKDSIYPQGITYWRVICSTAGTKLFEIKVDSTTTRYEWHTTGHVILPILTDSVDLDSMTVEYGRLWDITRGVPDTMRYTVVTCPDRSVYTNPCKITNNPKVVSIDMPYMIHITPEAFRSCSGLQSIVLPEVGDIGKRAFASCSSLRQIYLPEAYKIEDAAFEGCTSLFDIDLPQLAVADTMLFYGCSSLARINAPKLTIVKRSAFEQCGIEEAEFPNVEVVEDQAFESCYNLHRISLPKLKSLGENAFLNCWQLEEVVLPAALADSAVKHISIKNWSSTIGNLYFSIAEHQGNLAVIRSSNISNDIYTEQSDTLDFSKAPIDCRKLVLSRHVKEIKSRYSNIRHKEIEVAFDNPVYYSFRNTVYNKDGIVLNAQGVEHAYFMNFDIGTGYRDYDTRLTRDLKTIFIRYPQYDNIHVTIMKAYQTGERFDSAFFKNVTLQIPYGFRKFCHDLPQYQLYGSIEELSPWETLVINVEWSLKRNLRGTYINKPFRFYAILIVSILLLIASLAGYYQLGKRKASLAFITLAGHFILMFLVIVFFYTLEFNYRFMTVRFNIPLTLMVITCILSLFTPWVMFYYSRKI